MSDRLAASAVIDLLVDEGSWRPWDRGIAAQDLDTDDRIPAGYRADLRRARERSGVDESVLTGRARLGGHDVVLVVSEFGFLGGSIGAAAGQRIVAAVRRATVERIPVLALPASGGTRMQEGTSAFLQMAAIAAAVLDHRRAGLPYLVYLRHPTTGGVFASWGSLGHLTWAEPDALIGFLGPRVYAGLHGIDFPDGVQEAQNLVRHGLIDAVVPVSALARTVAPVLRALAARDAVPAASTAAAGIGVTADPVTADPVVADRAAAWRDVEATRDPDRLGLIDFLDDAVVITGSGPIRLALQTFGARVAMVIGQDRVAQAAGHLIAPRHLRVARRGIAVAAELGLPIVTLIDTPGAELSAAAENDGLATEIAHCTADLVSAPQPTVSVLLGQGAGGAALALFPADLRLARPDAWLSPLPPEGASLIVHRDTDHAAELSAQQRIRAFDLAVDGDIDRIVDGDGDSVFGDLRAAITAHLATLPTPDPQRRGRVGGR